MTEPVDPPAGPPHRLGMALVTLHLTAIFNTLFAVALIGIGAAGIASEPKPLPGDALGGFVVLAIGFVFLLLLAGGAELVAWGIRRRRGWSWVTGIVLFIFHATSCIYLPLVGFGLWGLLDAGSQRELRRME